MVRVWSSGQSPVWYRTEVMQYRVTADCVWVEWMCVAGRFFFGSISVFVLYFLVMDENSGTLTSHTSFVCVCVCLSLLFFSVYLGSGEWRVCFCLFRRHRMIWHLALFGLFKGIQHALFGCCFLLVDFLNSVLSVTVSVVLNMWLRVVSQVSLVFV